MSNRYIKPVMAIMVVCAFSACYAQPGTSSLSLSNGMWVSERDSLTTVVVNEGALVACYKGTPKNNVAYVPSLEACNSSYKPKRKEAFFVSWHDGACYEVEGYADEYLVLTNTSNGSSIKYHKKKR